MEPDGKIRNVVQQMFALRSVEVIASASERVAKGTLSKVKSARSASKKGEPADRLDKPVSAQVHSVG